MRLVSTGPDGEEHSTDVMRIAKSDTLVDLANLGLTLAEGKLLLAGLQQEIVAAQARLHAVHRPDCHGCGKTCQVKDYRPMGLRRCSARSRSGYLGFAVPDVEQPRRA
jgi:hypothetical protein